MTELPVNNLISVDHAIEILDAVPVQPREISVPLLESQGLHLAQDVHADRDYPPFDKAVMDGFAIRSGTSTQFEIIQTVAAGQVAAQPVGKGEAMAIMTGAPLPFGADAVVPIEWTSRQENQVTVNRAVKLGNAIARRGSDSALGQLLLSKGMLIGPPQIAVLASVGKSMVSVYAAPEVALLSTGDELIGVEETPEGSQIRNSNRPMMIALLTRLGCTVRDLGIVRDIPSQIESAIENGLHSDVLFITGGMSMGEHDYVPGLLKKSGLNLVISKLRIKPGKPFVFATGRSLVFGLPGNPISGYVCTVVLADRILARLRGATVALKTIQAVLAEPMPANGAREFYLPAVREGERLRHYHPTARPIWRTLARANCLIVRSENAPAAHAGDPIALIDLP